MTQGWPVFLYFKLIKNFFCRVSIFIVTIVSSRPQQAIECELMSKNKMGRKKKRKEGRKDQILKENSDLRGLRREDLFRN